MFIMEYKGFKASIQRAHRLTGEGVHGLPSGTSIDIHPVDAFEKPLDSWIKGPGNYVVPVEADWGLWFDWTMNDNLNTAIMPTVKGMNPITGRRTNGFALERYEEKCPIHNIKFKDGLFCEKCNFKWPKQNYVAAPNTLWWDGFRTSDGKVRQFFFTEDLLKSIPEQVIGKEDTIPAFGFAFYRTKKRRELKKSSVMRGMPVVDMGSTDLKFKYFASSGDSIIDNNIVTAFYNSTQDGAISKCVLEEKTSGSDLSDGGIITPPSANVVSCSLSINENHNVGLGDPNPTAKLQLDSSIEEFKVHKKKKNLEVGVGAGAEIAQDLTIDSLKLSDWEDKPVSVMRLYFVFTEQFKAIADKGLKNLASEKEGYLSGLPVG